MKPTRGKKPEQSSVEPSPPEDENLIDWVEDGMAIIITGAPKPGRPGAKKDKEPPRA